MVPTLLHADLATANVEGDEGNCVQASKLAGKHSQLLTPIVNFVMVWELFEGGVYM